MDKEKRVTCCPKCKEMVIAKDYRGTAGIVGFFRSNLSTIRCSCGYNGLPVEFPLKEYIEWKKQE